MRQALTERCDLIEDRADVLLDKGLTEQQSWTAALGTPPKDTKAAATWRLHVRTHDHERWHEPPVGSAPDSHSGA